MMQETRGVLETGSGPADAPVIEARPLRLDDIAPAAAMGLMFLGAQVLAILVAGPFQAAGIRAFEDPENVWNPVWYLGLILGFTFLILLIAKYKLDWLIQVIFLGAIGATMVYVFWPLFDHFDVDPLINLVASTLAAAALTWLLYKWPEWFIVDSVGILVSAGAAAIFGVSFGVLPALILLVLLAAYDYIAVYKTRHMLGLADTVVNLRLPIMLVVPKHRNYSFLEERANLREASIPGKPRDAMFMGLGDIVIPSVMVVVAYHGLGNPPAAIGSLIGIFCGFVLLMAFVLRGKAHAGLPSLNGGAILGFFVGFAASGEPWAALNLPGIG